MKSLTATWPWLLCLSLRLGPSSSLNPLEQEGPEVACLDHSDCTQLGHKFGCLLYRCVDHSLVQSCQSAQDCPEDWDCIRTRLPGYPPGLCVPQSSLLACSASCTCCGQTCCPPSYQSQWADMSCVSDQQCRAWATGQFCCEEGRCCDSREDYQEDYSLYQYQYDYYNNNYSDYYDTYTTHHYQYEYTTTSPDNSSDLVQYDIFPGLLNETSTESAENDYESNNASDLFEATEPELVNETSAGDYYQNNNTSDLFEYPEDIFPGLDNETTTETAEVDYEITNSSDLYSDTELEEDEISFETSYGYRENDADEVADVEIVTIDKTEDEEEQVVKVTTFYETFNKTAAEEKLYYDPTNEKEEEHAVEVSEVVTSGAGNGTREEVYFSGSGDVSEDLSVENVIDEYLTDTDGLQIENFSLETDERELSTVASESSLESSLKYNDVLDDLQGEFDVDLQLETSGSGEQLWLEENNDPDLEGSGGSEQFGEIGNISQTSEEVLTESTVSGENDLDVAVEDVEVVKNPTNLVGKSTNEVAWKSDAIGKKISVSLIIFLIFPLNL